MAHLVSCYNIFPILTSTQTIGGVSLAVGVAQRLAGTVPIISNTVVGQIVLDEFNRISVLLNSAQIGLESSVVQDLSVNSLLAELTGSIDTTLSYTQTEFETIMNTVNLPSVKLVKVI